MNNLLVWPVLLPLLGSLLILVVPRLANLLGLIVSLFTLGATAVLVVVFAEQGPLELALSGWAPGLGIALRADGLSVALLAMGSLVALAAGIYATGYFADRELRGRFWSLWLLLSAALHALLLSGDLFNLYITLELLALVSVGLSALGGSRAALEAALRYLTIGLLGSLVFLLGVTLLYAAYGTLDLVALADRLQPEPVAWVALTLLTVGLLIKSALFPLHFWLPPAHANAPAPVSAVLSALVVKAAFYMILRLWFDVFDAVLTQEAANLLGVLGAVALLWGSWRALLAERLKLLAAYSTVAQLGYLFLFLPLLLALPPGPSRDTAFGALVLLALSHGFAKSALFLGAGVILQRAGHDRIADLGGTARALPVTTFVLALAGVALIGLPPSGTFLAKWQLLASAIETGQWLWLPVVGVGTLLAGAYCFRVLGHAFGPDDRIGSALAVGGEEIPALLLALTATVVLGLGAAGLWEFLAIGAVADGGGR